MMWDQHHSQRFYIAMANVAVETLRDSMALMNNEMRNLLVRLNAMEQNSKFLSDSLKS